MLDLTNLQTIQSILRENGLKPRKGYGQNFLLSQKVLTEITEVADLSEDDIVVEIGPGLGVLTQELAKHAKLVLAIESDYSMVEWLRKYFKNQKNVKIIHEDILQLAISDLLLDNYKVVSNLPYNITSPVIRKFLESVSDYKLKANSYQLDSMVLMVQKEVAERLTAKPGSADRGILTVMVELFGGAEIIEIVPRNCFYPIPKVDSAIIKIVAKSYEQLRKATPDMPDPSASLSEALRAGDSRGGQVTNSYKFKKQLIVTDRNQLQPWATSFMRFVKVGFSQKRRQIHHPLSANLHLPLGQIKDILKSVGIDSTKRAEDLSLGQWIKLYDKFNL